MLCASLTTCPFSCFIDPLGCGDACKPPTIQPTRRNEHNRHVSSAPSRITAAVKVQRRCSNECRSCDKCWCVGARNPTQTSAILAWKQPPPPKSPTVQVRAGRLKWALLQQSLLNQWYTIKHLILVTMEATEPQTIHRIEELSAKVRLLRKGPAICFQEGALCAGYGLYHAQYLACVVTRVCGLM